VVDSPGGDALRLAQAYLGFVHDRLNAWAPSVRSLALCHAEQGNPLVPVLTAARSEGDGGYYDLAVFGGGPLPPVDVALRVPLIHDGRLEGAIVFDVPEELPVGQEMQRRLMMHSLCVVAGMRIDIGDDWWSQLEKAGEAVQIRDVRHAAHVERVAGFAHIILRALTDPLRLTPDFCDAVVRYAPLHDVGQVVFPDHVMHKPGRLDPAEWAMMQSHTTRGRRIVDLVIDDVGIDAFSRVDVLRSIVELHHETLDGSGYPNGLAQDEVPLEARIVAVADIFDALTSDRPYKPGWTADEALAEMDRMVEVGKLDGRCLTALVTQPSVLETVAALGIEVLGVPAQ
jgi:HD-GYP domain-containing protein (c-di-GMP phosphodiesterase class II)